MSDTTELGMLPMPSNRSQRLPASLWAKNNSPDPGLHRNYSLTSELEVYEIKTAILKNLSFKNRCIFRCSKFRTTRVYRT